MLEKEKTRDPAQSSTAFVQEAGGKNPRHMSNGSSDFLMATWNKTLSAEIYWRGKSQAPFRKKSLEEQMARIEQKRTGWLEPMAEWIKRQRICLKSHWRVTFLRKRLLPKAGSNLVLAGREARVSAPKSIAFPPQNQWTALCAANQKVGQFSEVRFWCANGDLNLRPLRCERSALTN